MKIRSAAPPQVSFFDEPFCWNFPIARRLSEAKAYIETPSPLTSELNPGPHWLWLYNNGFASLLRSEVDKLCPTICSDGFEGLPEILRAPPKIPNSPTIIICWKYSGKITTHGTPECYRLPEPNYRFGNRRVNPALAPSSLTDTHAFVDILSQSIGEEHLEALRTSTVEAQYIGASVLVVIALDEHFVVEVWTAPLFAVSSREPQIRRNSPSDMRVRQWS